VSFKHWIAMLGHPIMVLILLTEPDPQEAQRRLMKRCAYVLIPISILLIRYYPQWGRYYSQWGGGGQKAGVAMDKNSLGVISMIFGFFFVWHLLNTLRLQKSKTRRNELLLCAGFLSMIAWLFWGLNCGTALMSLVVGSLIVVLVGLPSVNKRFIGTYLVAVIVSLLAAELTLGLNGKLLDLLGKDPTMTGRTEMWPELLEFDINPVLGAGFESFWTGNRPETLWERHSWKPNEAHNGYLETYLNLGLIGLSILIGLVVDTYRKSCRELLRNFEWGRFRLGFLGAVVIYNWTEAAFKTLHPVWFVYYLIAMGYPKPEFALVERSRETIRSENDRGLFHSIEKF
jgi:O-antigen ligase